MKKLILKTSLAAALCVGTAQAATIFNGGALVNAGNWNNGLPVVGTNPGTISVNGSFNSNPVGWEVTQTGGNVTSTSNRSFGAVDALSAGFIWNLSDGDFNFTGNLLRGTVGSNYAYTFNMSGGTFGIGGVMTNSASSFFNLSGGTATVATWSSGGTLAVTGGSLNITTALTMTAGGSTLVFGGGSSTVTTASLGQNGNTLINFLPGSGANFTVTGFTSTDYSTMWGNGRLKFNGANTGLFGDHFQVTGATLALIPEPSVWALLAGGLTTLVIFRRRKQA